MKKNISAKLSVLLQAFFSDYLISQQQVSQHTIMSYRDTFRLLLQYAKKRLKKNPSALMLDDINALFVRGFLKHLEKDRGASARTRNQRLAAIRSCFSYASVQYPEKSEIIQQVLAIRNKRHARASISFLVSDEIDALLAAPDRTTWAGRRDHTLLLLAIRTGLRVSELTGLQRSHVTLGSAAYVRCFGKGRKQRTTPITKTTALILKSWLQEPQPIPSDLVFTNARGTRFTPEGIQYLLSKHVAAACNQCPSLKKKRISPHVLRHTAAMQLLQSDVDPMMIAIWLGHESVQTTHVYLQEDLKMKEKALNKTKEPKTVLLRYKPDDDLLAFLNGL